jgi:hypothetical protein
VNELFTPTIFFQQFSQSISSKFYLLLRYFFYSKRPFQLHLIDHKQYSPYAQPNSKHLLKMGKPIHMPRVGLDWTRSVFIFYKVTKLDSGHWCLLLRATLIECVHQRKLKLTKRDLDSAMNTESSVH